VAAMADLTDIRNTPPVAPPGSLNRVKEKQRSDQRKRRQEPGRQEKIRRRAPDDGKPHIDDYA